MDKPAGPTSHDVVAHARRVCKERSIGHTGTLDPFASGLLVLLLGKGTRVARFLDGLAKTYLATARLGQRTTTDDLTGEPVGEGFEGPWPGRVRVAAALAGLVGAQEQTPPAYSAKKRGGERAYARARRGESVELAPAAVTVYTAELLEVEGRDATFRVTVSTGTYIRALARDLGEALGTGAHLTALRRESIGSLQVENAVPLDQLEPGTPLWPLGAVLGHLPRIVVDEAGRKDLAHGRPIRGVIVGTVVLAFGTEVVAVAEGDGEWLKPTVVLVTP
ncbi:MAG TPA: tRNA pseudouridine(55) synthase TruB [Gemmatimonadales bacterium]|nr:tRNA pseudouridine(55) synthase TruB [Gemmatimonadales bacterium]